MRKWDYYIQAFESDDVNYMEDELTDRGNEGWEAVCVLRCGRLLMKREKKNSMVPVDKEPERANPQFHQ